MTYDIAVDPKMQILPVVTKTKFQGALILASEISRILKNVKVITLFSKSIRETRQLRYDHFCV